MADDKTNIHQLICIFSRALGNCRELSINAPELRTRPTRFSGSKREVQSLLASVQFHHVFWQCLASSLSDFPLGLCR